MRPLLAGSSVQMFEFFFAARWPTRSLLLRRRCGLCPTVSVASSQSLSVASRPRIRHFSAIPVRSSRIKSAAHRRLYVTMAFLPTLPERSRPRRPVAGRRRWCRNGIRAAALAPTHVRHRRHAGKRRRYADRSPTGDPLPAPPELRRSVVYVNRVPGCTKGVHFWHFSQFWPIGESATYCLSDGPGKPNPMPSTKTLIH